MAPMFGSYISIQARATETDEMTGEEVEDAVEDISPRVLMMAEREHRLPHEYGQGELDGERLAEDGRP